MEVEVRDSPDAELLRTDEALYQSTSEFWHPLPAYDLLWEELRDDITDHDIIRWLLVQYLLTIDKAIFQNRDEIRHYMRRMVGASILREQAGSARARAAAAMAAASFFG